VEVAALSAPADANAERSAQVAERVAAARGRQQRRAGVANARLTAPQVERDCVPGADAQSLLAAATRRMGLSARAYHRVLKVARTIADLAGSETIAGEHVAEAIRFRQLDRAEGANA
jgi:magnesium chelatase family protein